jgi:predicted transposase YbfD/YdcC
MTRGPNVKTVAVIPDVSERQRREVLMDVLKDVMNATCALTNDSEEFYRMQRSVHVVLNVIRDNDTSRIMSDAECSLMSEVKRLIRLTQS